MKTTWNLIRRLPDRQIHRQTLYKARTKIQKARRLELSGKGFLKNRQPDYKNQDLICNLKSLTETGDEIQCEKRWCCSASSSGGWRRFLWLKRNEFYLPSIAIEVTSVSFQTTVFCFSDKFLSNNLNSRIFNSFEHTVEFDFNFWNFVWQDDEMLYGSLSCLCLGLFDASELSYSCLFD